MAAPILQAEGAISAVTTGNLTVTLPAHQADDILVLSYIAWIPATPADATQVATPSGWTNIRQTFSANLADAPPTDGWQGNFYLRATSSSETNPTFTRPGDWDTGVDTCFAGRAYTIRGCVATGTPWDQEFLSFPGYAANLAFGAITVSGPERMVAHFFNSEDDQAAGAAPAGWTAGTAVTDVTGTAAGFQTFRKDNVSASTSADASSAAAPAQGEYLFWGISFKPPPPPAPTLSVVRSNLRW